MSRMPKAGAEDCYTSDSQDWASWVTRPQLEASGQATSPCRAEIKWGKHTSTVRRHCDLSLSWLEIVKNITAKIAITHMPNSRCQEVQDSGVHKMNWNFFMIIGFNQADIFAHTLLTHSHLKIWWNVKSAEHPAIVIQSLLVNTVIGLQQAHQHQHHQHQHQLCLRLQSRRRWGPRRTGLTPRQRCPRWRGTQTTCRTAWRWSCPLKPERMSNNR